MRRIKKGNYEFGFTDTGLPINFKRAYVQQSAAYTATFDDHIIHHISGGSGNQTFPDITTEKAGLDLIVINNRESPLIVAPDASDVLTGGGVLPAGMIAQYFSTIVSSVGTWKLLRLADWIDTFERTSVGPITGVASTDLFSKAIPTTVGNAYEGTVTIRGNTTSGHPYAKACKVVYQYVAKPSSNGTYLTWTLLQSTVASSSTNPTFTTSFSANTAKIAVVASEASDVWRWAIEHKQTIMTSTY